MIFQIKAYLDARKSCTARLVDFWVWVWGLKFNPNQPTNLDDRRRLMDDDQRAKRPTTDKRRRTVNGQRDTVNGRT